MKSHGTPTEPESVLPRRRYWLHWEGTAVEVADHLKAAHYAQAESSEYDRAMPWGYEDMFRHGWMRIHTEQERIWADGGQGHIATPEQQQWIERAREKLSSKACTNVHVASAMQDQVNIMTSTDENTSPTNRFLQILGFSRKEAGK